VGSPLTVRVEFAAPGPIRPILGVALKTAEGMPLFAVSNRFTHDGSNGEELRNGNIECNLDSLPLMPGSYLLDLYLGDFGDPAVDLDVVREAVSFEVAQTDALGTGRLPPASLGPFFWRATWAVDSCQGRT
jgi:hypothetical protein